MASATQPFHITMSWPNPRLLRCVTAELAWLVLALLFGATILVYCMMHRQATHRMTDATRVQANSTVHAITARLDLSAQILSSAAAMLALDRTVQNATWQQYQRNLANQGWPAEVQQLGYAQRIKASEKTALRDAMRADAMPDYQIHPMQDRTEHAPILFIAPGTETHAERPGLDLFSSPAAREALHTATDSGAPAFHTLDTSASTVSIGANANAGRALLVLPLFPGNAIPPTLELRRRQAIGFVFAFIDINKILHTTDASPFRAVRLIELADSSATVAARHQRETGTPVLDIPFELFGKRWQVEVTLPAAAVAQTYFGNAEIVTVCGVVISLLLFSIIRLLAAISRVTNAHSKRTSREIRELKHRLSASLSCSDHAILVVDRRHCIMGFNPKAESIFAIGSETAIGIELSRFLPHKLTGAKRNMEGNADKRAIKQVSYRLPNNPNELACRYNGERFPFEATIYKCEQRGQPATMIFLKDLTAQASAQSTKSASSVAIEETHVVELVHDENAIAEGSVKAVHFEITVGDSIASSSFTWMSQGHFFDELRANQNATYAAQAVSELVIQRPPISVCEFIDSFIHVDDRAKVKQLWTRGLYDRSDIDCLYRILRADGSVEVMRQWMTSINMGGSQRKFAGLLHKVPQQLMQRSQPQRRSLFRQSVYSNAFDGIATGSTSRIGVPNARTLLFQGGESLDGNADAVETDHLHRQLQSRLLHFDCARDEQQKKLAREMHDDFGQLLTAMKMDLIVLQSQLSKSDNRLSQQLRDVSDLVDTMVVSVRRIITNLPPEQIEDYGLVKGLDLLARAHSHRYKICCRLHVKPHLPTLDASVNSPIYRIVQEALNNIAKHARATAVDITLEHSTEDLHVRVTDDGCGIAPAAMISAGGFGLIGMRERVNTLNGEMTIETAAGAGTKIHITIPLAMELVS